MEELNGHGQGESLKIKLLARQRPVHLFLIRFFGIVMAIAAAYNLHTIFGLGLQAVFLMSKTDAPRFINVVIINGAISFFCGIGIILLSDASRLAAVVVASLYIVENICALLAVQGGAESTKKMLVVLTGNGLIGYHIFLVIYQAVFIYFFTREYIRGRFELKEQKRYLFVGMVFLLAVYAGSYDIVYTRAVSGTKQSPGGSGKYAPVQGQNQSAPLSGTKKTPVSRQAGSKIKGIIVAQGKYSVMIDNKFYNAGDAICGGTIIGITPERITIRFPQSTKEFKMGEDIKK